MLEAIAVGGGEVGIGFLQATFSFCKKCTVKGYINFTLFIGKWAKKTVRILKEEILFVIEQMDERLVQIIYDNKKSFSVESVPSV